MNIKSSLLTATLCLGLTTPAFAQDLVFTITNATSEIVTHFYTSPVDVNDWEDDVFDNDVLEPGETIEITVADGRRTCVYDMKFEFQGSSKLETTVDTQDLCEMNSYTLTE